MNLAAFNLIRLYPLRRSWKRNHCLKLTKGTEGFIMDWWTIIHGGNDVRVVFTSQPPVRFPKIGKNVPLFHHFSYTAPIKYHSALKYRI